MASLLTPPAPDEYAPFYHGYVAGVADADLLALLESQVAALRRALGGLSDEAARYRYAPGKWSIKDVVGHLADAERVMAYRALRIARGDATPLPGFDENAYAEAAGADARPLADLLDELAAVRTATLALVRALGADALARRGTANGQPVTVRALVFIVAGHAHHHARILAERYGVGGAR